MKLNQIDQIIENFFSSNAVKNIFDNIRNLTLSTIVLIAGNFLLVTVVPASDTPQLVTIYGNALIYSGFLLMLLCVINGYVLLKKSGISVIKARLISIAYFFLTIAFFVTLLKQKGFTV